MKTIKQARWVVFTTLVICLLLSSYTWSEVLQQVVILQIVLIPFPTILAAVVKHGEIWDLPGTQSQLVWFIVVNVLYFFSIYYDWNLYPVFLLGFIALLVNWVVSSDVGSEWMVWWDNP